MASCRSLLSVLAILTLAAGARAQSYSLAENPLAGAYFHIELAMTLNGELRVHGFTKPVTAQVQVQLNGNQLEVAGSIGVDMRDFAIAPPDISFTTAEPQVVIEFRLLLQRA